MSSPRPRTAPLRTRPLLAAALGLLAATTTMLGCQIAVVDLGSNHAISGADAGADADGASDPVITSDCPSVTEAQIATFYGHPCDSTCSNAIGPARVVGSAAELVAVTSTQWRTCAGEVPWPADVVGLEFQPGCTIFLLHDAPDGGVARGVLPDDQGNFNVIETTSNGSVTREIELYFPTWTWRASVTSSDCPHRMTFEGSPGKSADFAAISSAPGPN
ncbi:MAG: hypothetical protein ABJE95_15695 [Byssovorax sp.]